MAMNVGSGSGIGSSDPEVMIDINTTPLIDVMLVLLVMLIITLPIQLHSVNLNMPTGNPPPPKVLPEVVKIDIDAGDTVYWNGVALSDRETLEEKIRNAAGQQVQPEALCRCHYPGDNRVLGVLVRTKVQLGLDRLGGSGLEIFLKRCPISQR